MNQREDHEIDAKYQKALADSVVAILTKNGYQVSEGKIRKVLFSEVGLLIMIISFMVGVVAPYFTIKSDIALIQQSIDNINTNHETHIQDILKNIEDLKKEQAAQDLLLQQNSDAILALMGKLPPLKK